MGLNFNTLPSWAKGTIAVVTTVGVAVGVFYSVRGINKSLKRRKDEKGQTDEIDSTADELSKLNKNPSTKQKLSDSTIKSIANVIEIESETAWFSHSYYWSISSQLNKLKNNADFLALNKSFGTRIISGHFFDRDFTATLSQVIQYNLDQSDVDGLNRLLTKKGIKYKI